MPPEIRGWAEGIREVWLAHDVYAPFQRPGHWHHACNLRIGLLGGWRDQPLAPTHLTPDEQTTHISLWCLWGSPMIIGTPIERLDAFTLSLLSNDEVLEVNQDPLGIQGKRSKADGGEAVVKPLEDGTVQHEVLIEKPGGAVCYPNLFCGSYTQHNTWTDAEKAEYGCFQDKRRVYAAAELESLRKSLGD